MTARWIAAGVFGLGSGFVLLGQLSLPPVLAGAALFLAGASCLARGVLGSTPPLRGLLAKACLGFGCAGLALSVLMGAVAPFTGQRSQILGFVTGGVGCLAAGILIGAGLRVLRRAPPERE